MVSENQRQANTQINTSTPDRKSPPQAGRARSPPAQFPRQANRRYHAVMRLTNGIVDYLDLSLPAAPEALEGLRLAHITDLHVHGHTRRHRHIAAALKRLRPDLVVFTGDYVTRWRRHDAALEALDRLCAAVDPPRGMFGVYGNHDPPSLRQQFEQLPITWLNNAVHRFQDLPLEIWGADTQCQLGHDSLALAGQIAQRPDPAGRPLPEDPHAGRNRRPLRLLLCHLPSFLPTAADLSADVMFAGHTHGGQIRLPGARALRNSTDLPLRLTAGVLRHRNTLCCISRGLGEVLLPLRLFCRPQLPVYTLRRGAMLGRYTDHIINVRSW